MLDCDCGKCLDCRIKKHYPSLLQRYGIDHLRKLFAGMLMAKDVVSATARHVATGMQRATDDVVAQRLTKCLTCHQHCDGRCMACGCYVKIKASWAEQTCPLDQW